MSGTDSAPVLRWKSGFGSLPYFPGKLRLIDLSAAVLRSIGGNERRVCSWEGAEFYVDLRDRIHRQMWCGCYEPHVTWALRKVLRAGDTFLDLGTHIGYHSYFAARLVGPHGHVYAFEAVPGHFARLRKNLGHFPHAGAEHCAIWSDDGNLLFTRSESLKESGWGALPSVRNAPEREQIEAHGVLSMYGASEQGWKPSAQSKSMWKGLSLQFFEELSAYFGRRGQSCCLKCANHFLDKLVHRLQ